MTTKAPPPLQKRAQATRQRILDATLAMLAETSIDRVSTNAIAGRAGVNIASLYKYFADKHAILGELALAFGQRQSAMICDYLDAADPDTPMDQICDGMVDCYIDDSRGNPALVHLQRSLIIYPELQDACRATSRDISVAMAPFLERWGIDLSDRQLDLAMLCLGEVSTALQDLALSRDLSYDAEVIAEMKLIFRAYYQARATAQT
ncbi:MAG: TetR/AcrR family transcriptional regulator [Rhodospirillaceae bacterium]|nr:TetR/AcrR family transcriptional regulator [Rhodospirillaceae bacterium]